MVAMDDYCCYGRLRSLWKTMDD